MRALRTEMKGELATVLATFREAEAQRSIDYNAITMHLKDVPTAKTIWKAAGAVAIGMIAFLAFLWQVLDTGAALSGSVTEQVVQAKESESKREAEIKDIKGLIEGLRKERSNGQANGNAVQPATEGNVVGNRT